MYLNAGLFPQEQPACGPRISLINTFISIEFCV